MIHSKVQYDAYNRTFKLIDHEFRNSFEDGALYEVALPLNVEAWDETDNVVAVGEKKPSLV